MFSKPFITKTENEIKAKREKKAAYQRAIDVLDAEIDALAAVLSAANLSQAVPTHVSIQEKGDSEDTKMMTGESAD